MQTTLFVFMPAIPLKVKVIYTRFKLLSDPISLGIFFSFLIAFFIENSF